MLYPCGLEAVMRGELVCGGEYSPMDFPALSFACATCMENHCLTPSVKQ